MTTQQREQVQIRLREFLEDDRVHMIEIHRRVDPDYQRSLEQWRYQDAHWDSSKYYRLRLVAEDDGGRILGFGSVMHMPWQFQADKYLLGITVDPPFGRQGIGSALYGGLMDDLERRDARIVRANTKESRTAAVDFLRKRGFRERERRWESRLDAGAFDFERFAGAEDRVAQQGIVITTLADEWDGDEQSPVLRRADELDVEVMRDVPSADAFTPSSFEEFLTTVVKAPGTLLDAWFLAKDGDRYAGMSNMFRSLSQPHVLHQGFTGVRREYRGRGIALALKLQTVRYARAHGHAEIRTMNHTANRPMLRINEAMGFAKQPAWIDFEKLL